MNIRKKLFISMAFITVTTLLTTMSLVYFSMVAYFEKNISELLEANVIHAAKAIDEHMFTRVNDLNIFSNNPLFYTSTVPVISNYLRNIVTEYPFYELLAYVNNEGIVISSSDRTIIGKNIFQLEPDIEEEFQMTINGGPNDVFISDISKTSQKELETRSPLDIELLSDVVDANENKLGVLVGYININAIRNIVLDIDEHTIGNEHAYLVNDLGEIVITADNRVKTLSPHPDFDIKNLKQKLEGDENGYLIYVNHAGNKVISGYADLAEYGTNQVGDWSLLSSAPYKDIMQPVYQMVFQSLYVFMGIFGGAIILVIFFSRTLAKPLIALKDAVGELSKGEFIKIEVESKDEIGELSTAFNIMTEELEQSKIEKHKLEAKLRQAHKMEAIGTLAGGIAHDFNNILTAILGYTELAIGDIDNPKNLRKDLDEVFKGGNRAKELVKQILAFSHKSAKQLEPLRVQIVIKEVLQLLRSSIPTTIEIKQNIDPDCEIVLADPTQIHQVIMNLCTNAYQAMRETGGILTISLQAINFSKKDVGTEMHLEPGSYLKLDISDTGVGIPKEVKDRIFEPYFSTKEKGEGTGLGLAVVHGIIINLKGDITVYSEPERGTTFTVYLPVAETEVKIGPKENLTKSLPTGSEHILLVDDDEVIVNLNKTLLEKLGYRVTALASSVEALASFQKNQNDFDLVITDMTMPKITGKELAEQLLAIRPNLPIILCTGYSDLIDEQEAKAMGIRDYVMKPFNNKDFVITIRKVLDGS